MTVENRDNLGLIDGQTVYGMRLQSLAKASLGNGVAGDTVTTTALKVSERGAGANMSVDVAIGDCQIDGTTYTEAGVTNLAISAAHATNERIDLVVYDQSAGAPAVVTGTAHATNPQVPDVADDADIPLALVYVLPQDDASYTATITDAYIYDVRSFTSALSTGMLKGLIELPLYLDTHEVEGSHFNTTSTTYVNCGQLVMNIPALFTAEGKTVTAKFHAIVSVSHSSGATGTCQLYNSTTTTSISELISTDFTDEPYLSKSGSLTVGSGMNIVDGDTYLVRAKTTDGAASVYRAWLEFYWG